MSLELEQAIHEWFDNTKPVSADATDVYVELDDVRGEAHVVRRLARKIELSSSATCQALTGHKGSGKSTELLRLKKRLEEKGFFVVFCEARHEIDYNDVDFPEVLIAIIRQLAEQLESDQGITLKPGYFVDRWTRLKKLLLSEIAFEELGLSAGLAAIKTVIRSSPEARTEIRKVLEPDTGNWIDAANDVIGKAILELQKKGRKGLVIIADDLDKMITRPHGTAGCTTSEYLFIHRHPQLSSFKCHMVYTMPLALAYSHAEQTIANLYGGHPPVLSMTKIRERPPDARRHEPGLSKFRDLMDRRLQKAGSTCLEVFESEAVRDELVRLSGGQPSELMIYVREALVRGGLPITANAVAWAAREGRRAFNRQLREEHLPLLDEVRRTGKLTRTEANERLVRDLLESRAVLQYVNDEEWYAPNPVLPIEGAAGET